MRGIYLPYWTFDAQVDAQWTAEAGHYYYTTETYERGRAHADAAGAARALGARRRAACSTFSTTISSARRWACIPALLRGIEPFPTKELKPYDPGFVAGWIVERYQIDLVGAAQRARAAMDAKLQALCAQQVPGDTFRNLVVHADYSGADVQAHPRAGVAPVVHVRRPRVPVRA